MNFFELTLDKATRTQKRMIASLSCAGTFVVLYAIFVIYLGVYAYGSPDPVHSYYIDGLDTTGLSKASAETMAKDRGIAIRSGYPVDMAHLFRAWFVWGFWGSMIQIIMLGVFIPLFCLYKNSFKVSSRVYMIMQGLNCCSTFMWFILGFFWRFSKGGRVAAGDKLERTAGTTDDQWADEREKASEADGY